MRIHKNKLYFRKYPKSDLVNLLVIDSMVLLFYFYLIMCESNSRPGHKSNSSKNLVRNIQTIFTMVG